MKTSRSCKSTKAAVFACALVLGSASVTAAGPAGDSATEVRGFATVGYLRSTGNNFYGETLDGGDFDYYEGGINAYRALNPNISVAGQVLTRKAGNTDNGSLRLDYAFIDTHTAGVGGANYGARLGRVRNPMGLYNETRDVIFTRPTILLPQSVYYEGIGIREMLFSSDGLQLYADWDDGDVVTSAKFSIIDSKAASDQTLHNFSAGLPAGTSVAFDVKSPIFAQVRHERDGGRQRYAFSVVDIGLDGRYTSPAVIPFALDIRVYVLSGQYNSDNWTLTSEYRIAYTEVRSVGVSTTGDSDGLYVQYQYRFAPAWTGLLRHDVSFQNLHDRGQNVSRDNTIGLVWKPAADWQVNAEYHRIRGTEGIPRPDNPVTIVPRTNVLAVTLGYRF